MRVFVAEKPALGRAIAAVLPGPQQRFKTHIVSGEGNVVVWCAGHLLTQCMPEDYDPAHETWALAQLPIVPTAWRLKLAPKARELYQTIERFVRQASLIVHAGDPDREGQWVVDAVLAQIGTGDTPVKRLLISDLNPPAIRKALREMPDNTAYRGLRDAAVGRARADWLYGLNLTRLYTLKGRSEGLSGVLSVGRVQTPVLGLVVRRDRSIANFEAHPFYTVQASVQAGAEAFTAQWQPGERAEPYRDPEGRIIHKAYATSVADALRGQAGEVLAFDRKPHKEPPPLPFSLPELQKAAAKLKGLSPRRTLDLAQSLYEKHQLLTYPRSDCGYLPEEHHGQASEVRQAIIQTLGQDAQLTPLTDAVDLTRYGRCWNDDKVSAHHAIIPTPRSGSTATLSADERFVYHLVAHRYLLQFLPPRELEKTQVTVQVATAQGTEHLQARQRSELSGGWYAWRQGFDADDRSEAAGEMPVSGIPLPELTPGQALTINEAEVIEKQTTPPKPFTEATLLDAMTGIARYVEDPVIRRVLRETDGLGTPATQATILETLYQRGYLEKHRKTVRSTDLGKALIDALPDPVSLPDMTALWEMTLSQIIADEASLAGFMASVQAQVSELVTTGAGALNIAAPLKAARATQRASRRKAGATPRSPKTYPCPRDGCGGALRRIKGKHGFFLGVFELCRGVPGDPQGSARETCQGRIEPGHTL